MLTALQVEHPLPYAESMGTFRRVSPYYKESHHQLRASLRKALSPNQTDKKVRS